MEQTRGLDGLQVVENMVARDGIGEHYASLTVPFIGVCLNPALELR
jgi:hypothetical protein